MPPPRAVKAVPFAVLLLVAGFVLDATTVFYAFEHEDEVFALARTKRDAFDSASAVVVGDWLSGFSLVVTGLSTALLCVAVHLLLRGRRSGHVTALAVLAPHVLFTAIALPGVGWRDRAALDPDDLSAYFDPAVTPAFVRIADLAAVPLGFAGSAAALALLVLPATRHWVRRRSGVG
ncbi:hypothetical protein [Saccharothrix algeriensis]|uniref:Uncharacterized protein n=1 Tax=Saccharothrix algeriensis TaxID=173560 RepID=A0A8T8HXB8_9PSEU|nr:hypothetical protein [Saccharothrix algeriensis]MBM7814994.1 hypothetical protein [Saccharothrix algeriensis]QTR03253.1 hypothetical protein J7S33_30640 [Saccharothrix algeriensis]